MANLRICFSIQFRYQQILIKVILNNSCKFQSIMKLSSGMLEFQLEETYRYCKFNWRLIFFFVTPKKCYWHNKQRSISFKKTKCKCFQKLNEIMNSLCHLKLFQFQNTLNHHLNISITNDKKRYLLEFLFVWLMPVLY